MCSSCMVCEWNDCFLVVHFLKVVEVLMTQTCLMSAVGITSLMEVRHQCHLKHSSIWVGLIGDLSFYSFSTLLFWISRCFEHVVLKKSNLLSHLCTLVCSFNWTLVSPQVFLFSLISCQLGWVSATADSAKLTISRERRKHLFNVMVTVTVCIGVL